MQAIFAAIELMLSTAIYNPPGAQKLAVPPVLVLPGSGSSSCSSFHLGLGTRAARQEGKSKVRR